MASEGEKQGGVSGGARSALDAPEETAADVFFELKTASPRGGKVTQIGQGYLNLKQLLEQGATSSRTRCRCRAPRGPRARSR